MLRAEVQIRTNWIVRAQLNPSDDLTFQVWVIQIGIGEHQVDCLYIVIYWFWLQFSDFKLIVHSGNFV